MTSHEEIEANEPIYPAALLADARTGRARDVYHLDLIADGLPAQGQILDLGGGFAAHNAALAARGHHVCVVDTFEGYWADRDVGAPELLERFRESGVTMIDADLLQWAPDRRDRFDVIFSAHCLEHFHQSPLPLLRRCFDLLNPNGRLIVCVPNAVNARKRAMALVGKTNLASFDEFFLDDGPFQGHVREYSVGDLTQLAHALDLTNTQIWGRNWLGLSRLPTTRAAPVATTLDRLLRIRPGLCSDLYLSGSA